MSCVMSVDDHGLSLRLIATLEKIQKFISDWIQQEKDEALLYEENLCNNCCAFLSTVIMEDDDEVDSIELCIFLFGANMNDLTLEMFGFNCSGQLRGKSSIVAVYLDKYTSDLTLQQRLSPDAIKLLNAWERKRAYANLVAPNVEVEREIQSVIEFEIIDSFGGMHGRLKGIVPITSYAEKLNAAYRKSLEKYDNLKFEYDKISEQVSEIARKEGKKRKSDKIKEGMTKASLKKMGKMDDDNNFTSEQIEKAVTQRIVTNIKDACNTPQKLNTVMNNLVETFSNAHTDINLAKLTLADNFITYFKVLYTLVQCFPKHKDLSPVCMCSNREPVERDEVFSWGKGPTKHTETISTILPEIFSSHEDTKEKIKCMFGQIWRYQMLRVKLTPNILGEGVAGQEHGMILDAAPGVAALDVGHQALVAVEVGEQEVAALEVLEQEVGAPEVAAINMPMIVDNEVGGKRRKRKEKDDIVAELVNWVSCDKCQKWRVVNRPYAVSEVFQCANCDVPSEYTEVSVKKKKKSKK